MLAFPENIRANHGLEPGDPAGHILSADAHAGIHIK
jgi:hypothetical protein